MYITFVFDERVSTLDVAESTSISELLPLLSADFHSAVPLVLVANGRELTSNMTIRDAGLVQHDLVQCIPRPVQPAARPANRLTNQSNNQSMNIREPPNGAQMREILQSRPDIVERFCSSDPELAAALDRSPADYDGVIHRRRAEIIRRQEIVSDPFSAEAQALIEEEIRAQNIASNMEAALEHAPESFTRVTMLYVPMIVNGHPLKAFVDTGAQSTIMTLKCAESCGIARLLDSRFSGIAQGVGTAKILGRVHSVQVQFGNAVFTSSFTILEDGKVDFLLGLDQLRKHRASIDLAADCLNFAGESVKFLEDKDVPESDRSSPPTPSASSSSSSNNQSNNQVVPTSSSPPPPSQPLTAPLPATSSTPRLLTPNTPASMSQLTTSTTPSNQSNNQSINQSNNQTNNQSAASIESLVQLGFTANEAQRALTLNGGDVQRAASFLFNQSFGA